MEWWRLNMIEPLKCYLWTILLGLKYLLLTTQNKSRSIPPMINSMSFGKNHQSSKSFFQKNWNHLVCLVGSSKKQRVLLVFWSRPIREKTKLQSNKLATLKLYKNCSNQSISNLKSLLLHSMNNSTLWSTRRISIQNSNFSCLLIP